MRMTEILLRGLRKPLEIPADGLPVESRWYSALGAGSIWALDPRSNDFGPNAKYYRQDLRKLRSC